MEIVIASGKGGTGKTFITSNLLYYINNILNISAIGVDADVEAPDLVLALGGVLEVINEEEIYESRKAYIDYDRCNYCLNCTNVCNFEAIDLVDGKPVIIQEFCEGCGACSIACPLEAINYKTVLTGKLITCKTRYNCTVVTGDLELGGRNSGEIVYRAKSLAHRLCKELNNDLVIVDAAPGIACPVISSLAGADYLIIITEPTRQAIKGMERLHQLAKHFRLKMGLIINRCDLDLKLSSEVKSKVRDLEIEFLGEIPISYEVVKSYVDMTPILALQTDSEIKKLVRSVIENIINFVRLR